MSEYQFVEKPFLDQLRALGWNVIDQGEGIPSDPTVSRRTSFREVVLPQIFRESVAALNHTADGRPWLTAKQLDDLYDYITTQTDSLIEANENIQDLLYKHVVDRNYVTDEAYPTVQFIDFHHWERNHFLAINQLRIDTPGRVKAMIIPDIVLFVNGLPLVVVECKDANAHTANPMWEAFKQLMRYSDQREETHRAGLHEGEPRLFHFNQLLIRTCGLNADFGTITSGDRHFYPWRDIYPASYRTYTPPLGEEREQEILIQGMLPPATLLDLVRNFVLFTTKERETTAGHHEIQRIKLLCRYQQYRAVGKIIDKLRRGETPWARSGVIWHTQGSGKSLTMVFLVRKLRRADDLKDYKIILVNDRRDLEEQLSETADLAGEKVTIISKAAELHQLATPASNFNLVMVHKFQEFRSEDDPAYLRAALATDQQAVPDHSLFRTINPSDRILIFIDEAHRTHGSTLGENVMDAFPHATRIAFTGTPLIAERHQKRSQTTQDRFGPYIDIYYLADSVRDGATVKIVYAGRTAHSKLSDQSALEARFEDLCRELSDAEILAIKRKYGTTGDILEAEARIAAIAADLVDHYISTVLPDGFKAQVVASSKLAAVRYCRAIEQALAARLTAEQAKPQPDPDFIDRIAFLKVRGVVSADGTNELAEITQMRKVSAQDKAVDNFKRSFDPAKPLTGITFLVVCDMLLTGFDAPIEQVMYLDKQLKEHNLLQTIARVNRTAPKKQCGYIIDYIGLTNHLQRAFELYAAEAQSEVCKALFNLAEELPILESRFQRLRNHFIAHGIPQIESFVRQILSGKEDYVILTACIDLMADIRVRADFGVYLMQFLQSLEIILPNRAADPYRVPARRFGYIMAQVKQRYKDDSINVTAVGEKVRLLINDHLRSEGIDPTIPPLELTAPDFLQHINRYTDAKAKASEMEHAIRKHCKVQLAEDPVFYGTMSEKLEATIALHEANWDQQARDLEQMMQDVLRGRQRSSDGVDPQTARYRDLIAQITYGSHEVIPPADQTAILQLVGQVQALLAERTAIINFWGRNAEVSRLDGDLSDLMYLSGVPAIADRAQQLTTEILNLARPPAGR